MQDPAEMVIVLDGKLFEDEYFNLTYTKFDENEIVPRKSS
jgi:hypothetical protein